MKYFYSIYRGINLHLIFITTILIKLSYFNLPGIYPKAYDWYGWSLRDTVVSILSSLALLLFITAPLNFFYKKTKYVSLLLINLFITSIIIADLFHFRFFGDFISAASLGYAWQVSLISNSIFELVRPSDFLFFADILAGLIFLPWYFKKNEIREYEVRKSSSFFALVSAGLILLILPVREIITDKQGIFTFEFERFFGVKKIGLLNFHIYQTGKIIYQSNFLRNKISPDEKKWALDFIDKRQNENSLSSSTFGIAENKNLIIIMVESLMSFPIGLNIENQEITPNLSLFIQKSIYFENFFDQTWEGKTSDGELTSLHSLHPLYTGSVSTTYPANSYRGLPKILSEHGYTTISATAYNGELWNNRLMNKKLGFQKSYFDVDFELTDMLGLGLSDKEFFNQISGKLLKLEQPFMAFLITLSTHHPYSAFKNDTLLNLGEFEGTLTGDYIHAVHYFDSALREFIDALKLNGLWDQSVVVLYGDHHSDVGEPEDLENLLLKYESRYKNQNWKEYDYWINLNKIPFCIHLPKDILAGVRDVTCGHLDIANTLFDILGLKNRNMVSFGKNLMLDKNSLVIFNNGSFVHADTLFVTADGQINNAKAYNLSNGTQFNPRLFRNKVDRVWDELEISNLIITGDFIPDK